VAKRASLVDHPRRAAPSPATAWKPPAHAPRAPARTGKTGVTFWLDPDVHRQLRQLSLDTDQPIQGLMEEALDDLFHKHERPRIAQSPRR
jgi:hypothetical protein